MGHRSQKSGQFAVVLLGAAVIAASGLIAAAAPSFAAKARSSPVLSIGPRRLTLTAVKSSELFGVFCNSTTDCWAVGETKNKADTVDQVLHWTGKKWFTVAVPNPAGTANGAVNELFAVRCTSKTNCWAVGDSQKPNHAVIDQLLHLQGQKWSVVSAPAPGGTAAKDVNDLVDVACTSEFSCWAVGAYGIQGVSVNPQVSFNQALHWDGKKWTFVKSPNPGGNAMGDANFLNSVRCTGPDDCWAAGTAGSLVVGALKLRNVMLHWTGKKWAKATVPNPVPKGKSFINDLNTLACTAPNDCWAVGTAGKFTTKGFEHNEALHWTGKNWTLIKTPNPGGVVNQLFGVTCTAAGNCWAVGTAGSQPGRNQTPHWTGKTWSVVHAPNGGGTGKEVTNELNSVRCASASDCWAVGDADLGNNLHVNQILHWNGTKWGIKTPGPKPASQGAGR